MRSTVDRNVTPRLARFQCPLCRHPIEFEENTERCPGCEQVFSRTPRDQRDFRLKGNQRISHQFSYSPLAYDAAIDVPLHCERACAERRNRFQGVVPTHLTADQISYIPQATNGDIALDLGCGNGIHRGVLEELGYCYHGVDFAGAAADDLVDAHALPYSDGLFSLVFSIAVIEHLAQPLVALQEVHRVLRDAGYFIGTVAFLEPFHDNSFFHFTHLGLWHALQATGFAVETIMPIQGWHVARAQLEMGFPARLPRWVTHLLTQPFAWALESYALIGRTVARNKSRHQRAAVLARHAGAFFFVARKPSA